MKTFLCGHRPARPRHVPRRVRRSGRLHPTRSADESGGYPGRLTAKEMAGAAMAIAVATPVKHHVFLGG